MMNSIKGLTSPLWPIHFKPLPDELLSSWLVRLAHSHGLKVQTFCNLLFGNTRQLWNRDIDRLAPDWLLQALSDRTGTPIEQVFQSTLRSYEGWLYPKMRTSSTLQWITALKLHHRKFEGYGIQFCPQCLKNDKEPYFRKRWRVAFNTICVEHKCMLHDRCQNCGSGIAFHRGDMAHMLLSDNISLATCHHCSFNLQSSASQEFSFYTPDIGGWLQNLSSTLSLNRPKTKFRDSAALSVIRQLIKLLTSRHKTIQLHEFICNKLCTSNDCLPKFHSIFEIYPINERHHLIQLAAWLMLDFESRITQAWRADAIRYHNLTKDFIEAPTWYLTAQKNLMDWRLKKTIKLPMKLE